jgi:hypothetical protein
VNADLIAAIVFCVVKGGIGASNGVFAVFLVD